MPDLVGANLHAGDGCNVLIPSVDVLHGRFIIIYGREILSAKEICQDASIKLSTFIITLFFGQIGDISIGQLPLASYKKTTSS